MEVAGSLPRAIKQYQTQQGKEEADYLGKMLLVSVYMLSMKFWHGIKLSTE